MTSSERPASPEPVGNGSSSTGWPSEPTEPTERVERPGPVVPPSAPTEPTDRIEAVPADAGAAPVDAANRPADAAPVEAATGSPAGPQLVASRPGAGGLALRSAPVLALLLTTLLMAVAAAFVWYQVHEHDASERARRAALESSRDAARVLFSYDYRTLAKDFSAGRAVATGRFRQQYADTTSKVVSPVAAQKQAVVKADVVAAGVVRASPDTVVTIVFVNQVTTSSLTSGPKIDLSRVRMTLQNVDGRWLVSNVEAL
ncbi:MAG: hypothetical protein NVSMB4_01310 [Acidimicrobiales bacterium]